MCVNPKPTNPHPQQKVTRQFTFGKASKAQKLQANTGLYKGIKSTYHYDAMTGVRIYHSQSSSPERYMVTKNGDLLFELEGKAAVENFIKLLSHVTESAVSVVREQINELAQVQQELDELKRKEAAKPVVIDTTKAVDVPDSEENVPVF